VIVVRKELTGEQVRMLSKYSPIPIYFAVIICLLLLYLPIIINLIFKKSQENAVFFRLVSIVLILIFLCWFWIKTSSNYKKENNNDFISDFNKAEPQIQNTSSQLKIARIILGIIGGVSICMGLVFFSFIFIKEVNVFIVGGSGAIFIIAGMFVLKKARELSVY
jgi:hypothetical protein